MRASLNKIALIDKFIFSKDLLSSSEKVLLECYRILDAEFDLDVMHQKETIGLILKAGRVALRDEIKDIHRELFHANSKSSFQAEIKQFFKK